MGNKIYISFLGTNNYLPCIYYWDQEEKKKKGPESAVRFVQEETISQICRNWQPEDRIYIFVTRDAKKNNWLNSGHCKEGPPLETTGLKGRLALLKLKASIECVDIPVGHLEKDIWTIFDKIMQRMPQEATVYFDITHAFRSIPMLALVVLNFAKILKEVTLGGIFYGAFEVLGSFREVEKIEVKKRRAPIVDLTSFDRMMDWVSAVDRFVRSGDAQWMSRLGESEARAVLSATRGGDRTQHSIKRLAENLKEFTDAMSTCRGLNFQKAVSALKESIVDCEKANLQKPLLAVLGNLKSEVNPFNGKDAIADGIQAARWCMRHNLIQQAYTILLEFLISYFVKSIGCDPDNFKEKARDVASQAVHIYNDGNDVLPFEEWASPACDNPDLVGDFLKFFDQKRLLVKKYSEINQIRNDLNHAGFNKNPIKPEKIKKRLSALIDFVEKEIRL